MAYSERLKAREVFNERLSKAQNTAEYRKRRISALAIIVASVKSANRADLAILDVSAYCRPPVED